MAVHLARLSPGSQRAMRQVLDVIANLVLSGRANAETVPWAALGYQHSQAPRGRALKSGELVALFGACDGSTAQVGKSGDVRPGRITTGAVYQILGRLQGVAKVKPFSPHDCRRSHITALLAAGNSIAVVQKLAGHASVNTTARCDRSDEDAKRKAAETLHVPFGG